MSAPAALTTTLLKKIAGDFMTALAGPVNQRSHVRARELLAPNVRVTHDSSPTTEGAHTFMEGMGMMSKFVPNFSIRVVDIVAEVVQGGAQPGVAGRVWIYSKITGLKGGEERDSVDMMQINTEGQILESRDVQRITTPGTE